MKSKKYFILLCSALLCAVGCDKDFEEINSTPYAVSKLDPPLLFANAVRQTHAGHWEGEATIVQQFVNAYNLGATAGLNFNEDVDGFNTPKWNSSYPNAIRFLTKAIDLAKQEPNRVNMIAMMRIWKAYVFMTLVDTYADVPYNDAGKGDQSVFYPKYDDDAEIYENLYEEIKSATDDLSPTAEFVISDLFYNRPTTTAAAQTAQWKKLGNSLLLRLGMRYSKLDAEKAKLRVAEAVSRGVMTSGADDVYLLHNAQYNNPLNNGPRVTNVYFYYAAEPFVNQLKSTNDPRAKYMIGKYANPANATTTTPDVTLTNQFGFPVGYDSETIKAQAFNRGTLGGGLNYSQLNFNVLGAADAPLYFVTYSQTKLLMAEAAQKGWISGSAQTYYEDGVRASMDQWTRYPNTTAIPLSEQNAYLGQAGVAFDVTTALEQINTQYWIANMGNGPEAFANFRRSGFPALSPNLYNNRLNGGFARRLSYPNSEAAQNAVNYAAADLAIGGDNLTSRVFWDKP